VAGPQLNIFNADTLAWMAGLGATAGSCRWRCASRPGRAAAPPAGLQTEVFAYGRMPLAFSARCFTARHYNLPKDDCGFRCIEHPDGQLLQTREKEAFLVINGIQTQSARVHNLIGDIPRCAPPAWTSCACRRSRSTWTIVAAFDTARRAAQPDPAALAAAPSCPRPRATATGTASRDWI
jgi:hypothetical protein